jgi:predicted kinase
MTPKLPDALKNLKGKTLIMPVGLPACGKSTLCRALRAEYGDKLMIVSRDDILDDMARAREVSYQDAFLLSIEDRDFKKELNARFEAAVRAAQKHRGLVFWDMTNLTRRQRSQRAKLFPQSKIIGVVFDIDAAESKRRCMHRYEETEKLIPEAVIDQMAKMFSDNRPYPNEFDTMLTLQANGFESYASRFQRQRFVRKYKIF